MPQMRVELTGGSAGVDVSQYYSVAVTCAQIDPSCVDYPLQP